MNKKTLQLIVIMVILALVVTYSITFIFISAY